MTGPWRRALATDRSGRAWLGVLAALAAAAVGADLLASDLPLAVRVDGATHLLPCLRAPPALRGETQVSLGRRAEWQLRTPIPYGPSQTFASTGELRDGPPPWPPDAAHWLGTDELGRDVAARLVHGARVSLFVALVVTLLAVLVGLAAGAAAGHFGGWVDVGLSRLMEVVSTFPAVFLLLGLLSVLRAASLWPLVLVLGLTRWTDIARLVRAEVLRLEALDFMLAARALGASHLRQLAVHLVPNALGPVLVAATFSVSSAVLLETALSFLGLGVAPPTASWGELLTQAHRAAAAPGAWWLAVFPGAAIALTVLAVNGVGEALRRTLEGEQRGR